MDGDTFFTTDNSVILRNIHPTKAIMCMQSASSKIVPKEKDFILANKRSFGNLVGTITNYATSMYSVIVNFEEGSPEWSELNYRILCMQDFQQNSIDMAKGIEYRPVPKEWYDWKTNKILETDSEEIIKMKEFNQCILANKKPYFMIYNYDKLKREYGEYYRANEMACLANLGMTIEELRDKKNKTEIEQELYNTFAQQCPVNVSPSVINRIAWHIENHFADKKLFTLEPYDVEKLKSKDIQYSTTMYNRVKKLREEYRETLQEILKTDQREYSDIDSRTAINMQLLNEYIDKTLEVCGNEAVACNVLVDLCYSDNKSKDLLWECCGERLIKNMIDNGYTILHFPEKVENDGEFTFKGFNFEMKEVDTNGFNW